jgi:hypothetical protein
MGVVAEVILALATLVGALTAAFVAYSNRKLSQKTNVMVQQIDTAVNGKPPGRTSIGEQIQDLTDAPAIRPVLQEIHQAIRELRNGQ